MTEEDSAYTSVLLPGAEIELFSQDSETIETFMSLADDWRFARVHLSAKEGDVETAIQKYESTSSPDLVVIQTETIDDSFSGRLEDLAGNCSEGTAAMIVGPVNDVNLYRKLVGMGVSDYLVKPLQKDAFAENIAKTLIEKIGATGSCLIAMVGAKGGVGTTLLSEALAWGVSEKLEQKTFLMDAAGGWSTLPVGMDFEPSTTLAEASRAADEENTESLERMMFSASDKLTLLASGGDVMLEDLSEGEHYEALLNYLMTIYPVLIVDLSAAPANLQKLTLSRANEIMLIASPVLPAIRSARALMQEIKQLRGGSLDNVDVILNMQGMTSKYEVPKAQVEDGLDCKLSATIPFEPDLFVGTESQATKLSSDKTGDVITNDLLKIIQKITGAAGPEKTQDESSDKKGGLGGFISKLKTKS